MGQSVKKLFDIMRVDLSTEMSYEVLAGVLPKFDSQKSSLNKIRAKIIPQAKKDIVEFEKMSGEYSVTNGKPTLLFFRVQDKTHREIIK